MILRIGIWLLFPSLGIHYYLIGLELSKLGHLLFWSEYFFSFILYFSALKQHRKVVVKTNKRLKQLYVALFLLSVLSMCRGYVNGTLNLNAIAVYIITFFSLMIYFKHYIYYLKTNKRVVLMWYDMAVSISILVVLNLLGYYVLKIQASELKTFIGSISTSLGFTQYRIYFPFFGYTRGLSQLSSLSLIILIMWIILNKKGIYNFFMIVASFVLVLVSDARMSLLAIIFSVSVSLAILYSPIKKHWIVLGIILMLIFPFVYTGNYHLLESYNIKESYLTLSKRIDIWEPTIFYLKGIDILEFLIGSGEYGQITSGLSLYGYTFLTTWYDSSLITPHNTILQIIINQGLIGTFVYISFIIMLIYMNLELETENNNNKQLKLLNNSILLGIIFLGITESIYFTTSKWLIPIIICLYYSTQTFEYRKQNQ